MKSQKIIIHGRVQGVGFRPFIYNLAHQNSLDGWIKNTNNGVEIHVTGLDKNHQNFIGLIQTNAPQHSVIRSIEVEDIQLITFLNFEILPSKEGTENQIELTPDFGVCDICVEEILNHSNSRLNYAFTTCTQCGPRYSIIEQLPFDRHTTTMACYDMCLRCESEYQNSSDRRFHGQTNSCPDCSIFMRLYFQNKLDETNPERICEKVIEAWSKGMVVATKGLGGYLLTTSASNQESVKHIRKIKHRESKPFAIMCPDIKYVHDNFHIDQKEEVFLKSSVAPIVLLQPKNTSTFLGQIAPGLDKIGVMLPYTPLFHLLLNKYSKPIIATSANMTHDPIIYEDKEALIRLSEVDFILTYDREISFPQDDSLIAFSPFKKKQITLRRSRGLAPSFQQSFSFPTDKTILAFGADMKGAFAYCTNNQVYLSQYLGDLSHFDVQQRTEIMIERFIGLFKTKPDIVLVDKHPDYFSTRLGQDYSVSNEIPVCHFQHHRTHFGAILSEHDLWNNEFLILGIIWDGTGLGDDSHIWGGEFFIKENSQISRVGHLKYSSHIAGEKMAKEPRLSALSFSEEISEVSNLLKEKFTKQEWENYLLLSKKSNLLTSSMGRLFDAVASLIGLCDVNEYEGQAAILLEQAALRFLKHGSLDAEPFSFTIENGVVDIKSMLRQIAQQKPEIISGEIAFKFHITLVEIIRRIAEEHKVNHLAFSGGVFQNGLLVDLLFHKLENDFSLYFHQELSPNDENIAFGQLALYINSHSS
ncbi:carbamoyltransferase HypF [Cyclobacteriaceae bacterium]|nr:carbamoyltransferase HypF [Cyclobacteriaceae bacterium]